MKSTSFRLPLSHSRGMRGVRVSFRERERVSEREREREDEGKMGGLFKYFGEQWLEKIPEKRGFLLAKGV